MFMGIEVKFSQVSDSDNHDPLVSLFGNLAASIKHLYVYVCIVIYYWGRRFRQVKFVSCFGRASTSFFPFQHKLLNALQVAVNVFTVTSSRDKVAEPFNPFPALKVTACFTLTSSSKLKPPQICLKCYLSVKQLKSGSAAELLGVLSGF